MDFEKVDAEDRSDWLDHPVTEAFIQRLMADRAEGVNRIVELVKDPTSDPTRFEHVGGRLAVIDDLLAMVNAK